MVVYSTGIYLLAWQGLLVHASVCVREIDSLDHLKQGGDAGLLESESLPDAFV
jgi:hypothetical protein